MAVERPRPPHPDLVRRPQGSFGWIEDRLLHDGCLARLGPHGTAELVLLALAADRHGASYYSRDRMASRLGLTRVEIDHGLAGLLALRLVAQRPWRNGHPDGVWQLLPVPAAPAPLPTPTPPTSRGPASIATILAQLGLQPPTPAANAARRSRPPTRPPDSRGS